MASAAIPGIFQAVAREGRRLIDGRASNNAPLNHALELGANRIYVLPTGPPCALDEAPRGALPMLLHATRLHIGRRLQTEPAAVSREIDIVILPPPRPLPVKPTDFSRADELIEPRRSDARRYLRARESPETRRRGPVRRRSPNMPIPHSARVQRG